MIATFTNENLPHTDYNDWMSDFMTLDSSQIDKKIKTSLKNNVQQLINNDSSVILLKINFTIIDALKALNNKLYDYTN